MMTNLILALWSILDQIYDQFDARCGDLAKNKLAAVVLVALTVPCMFLAGDATATVFAAMIAGPMFFSKEPWINAASGCDRYWQRSGERQRRRPPLLCRFRRMP